MTTDWTSVSDDDLQAAYKELVRRQAEQQKKKEAERQSRMIKVYCLQCGGQGRTKNYGIRVDVQEAPEYSTCSLCNGSGTIDVERVK